jgi:hypothetical protein
VANEQDEAAMMTHGLDTMWKMGRLEVRLTALLMMMLLLLLLFLIF